MMTGALLGGSSVTQAARLQIVIMFMIAAATALASMIVVALCIGVVVDGEGRVRGGRIRPRWSLGSWIKDRVLYQLSRRKRGEGSNGEA
jgi:hypothetical protein